MYNLYNKSWSCNLHWKSKFPFRGSNHNTTTRLSFGGGGPTTLCISLTSMSIKPLWSSKEIIQTHTFFFTLTWSGGGLIKHDQKIIYFKSKSMNLPKAVTIYHSVNHVMNIVILTRRTFLFFHHLCINWIVRDRTRQEEMGCGMRNGSIAICIMETFWSQVDINLIREVPLAFCLLQTIKQHNCVCASLFSCSTVTQVEN